MLVEQVGLAQGICFLFWKKTLCLYGPRSSYCSQCQNIQSEMELDKDRWIQANCFQGICSLLCYRYFLAHWSVGHCLCSSLCDTLLSDSYRPLFIEWQRQASCVLFLINFLVNVSWYPKHWHLIFTYAIRVAAVVFIPFWREKEREGYLLSPQR